jgi:hypothetical protein
MDSFERESKMREMYRLVAAARASYPEAIECGKSREFMGLLDQELYHGVDDVDDTFFGAGDVKREFPQPLAVRLECEAPDMALTPDSSFDATMHSLRNFVYKASTNRRPVH